MQQRREEEGTVRNRDDYYADYDMPDAYERPLTRREKKERKKLARQERELRRRQAILEEKHRAAAEKEAARQARIQAKQDAEMARWEEKEARKQAKRDAKLAKKEEKRAVVHTHSAGIAHVQELDGAAVVYAETQALGDIVDRG